MGGGETELMDSSTRTQKDPRDAVGKDTRVLASNRGEFTPQLHV